MIPQTPLPSWIHMDPESDFPLENLPYGIITSSYLTPRAATRIGDTLVDLAFLAESGFFSDIPHPLARIFHQETLNEFISLGKPVWTAVRARLQKIFHADNPELRDPQSKRKPALYGITEANMLLPLKVGDYTDFYSSIEHATNVGSMFRDPENALLPNWKHLPVAYHGRSSSIVVTGTNLHRPKGQTRTGDQQPEFGPSKKLDFELEVAFVVGKSNALGSQVLTAEAEDHIFGLMLFNDLSARDIQQWEYVPLGPFLSKNFGSVVSPWIVTLDALEPFRTAGPVQDPPVQPYLSFEGEKNFDIKLEVWVEPKDTQPKRICVSNYKHLYWNMSQQLAHHTINGCNMRVGDLCASGTISGPDPGSAGSLLEITWNGKRPILYDDERERTFLEDHDVIVIKGMAEKNGLRIGFGDCRTRILPAN